MSQAIPHHTHMYTGPVVREDLAPPELVERFGRRWWFTCCEICADALMCPASGDLAQRHPEVTYDYARWRTEPADFEITRTTRRPPG